MFREVMNRRRMLLALTGVGGTALLIGLLSNREPSATPTEEAPSDVTPEPSPIQFETTYVEVSCAENQLAFDPTELVVAVGGEISLTFHNISAFFEHNWVLVNGDDSLADKVLEAAATTGPESGYIPADNGEIITHTPLVKAGESATITFATPPLGEYTYVCTFPGHCLAGMRGVLKVTPA